MSLPGVRYGRFTKSKISIDNTNYICIYLIIHRLTFGKDMALLCECFFFGVFMERVTFYVDGFNFYYGLKRSFQKIWGRFYWIDIVKLFNSFLKKGMELQKVCYFTAEPLNDEKRNRQGAFLNANELLNQSTFEVIRGKFLEKHYECPYCHADILKPEEKKTDVNISIRMIEDCLLNSTDTIILVSADTDLIPPLELIKKRFPEKKIKVYFPPSNFSNHIRDTLHTWKQKPVLLKKNVGKFEAAIMPNEVEKDGKKYVIPEKWKKRF